MTPAARLSAAITVLDRILAGTPAEQALTNWGRASRFAGSGDRNAVRDLVYDALRCKRSFAALGGGMTGRGLILGGLRASGAEVEALFTGEGHAPAVIGPDDQGHSPEGAEALDVPEWLWPELQTSLGDNCTPVLQALKSRAPVFLRVNLAKASVATAQAELAGEGIETQFNQLAKTCLEVTDNARKIQTSVTYQSGLVELQDAASQAVIETLPLQDGQKVLDLCAGGGGKTLAMAAQARIKLFAHDAEPRRMVDLPDRAKRAGAKVTLCDNPEKSAPYDLVLTDVPCSGSGSWRRDPQGKWLLTPDRLAALAPLQNAILDRAAKLVTPQGHLAYATCSLLQAENRGRIAEFLQRHPDWKLVQDQVFTPLSGGDGFYIGLLTR